MRVQFMIGLAAAGALALVSGCGTTSLFSNLSNGGPVIDDSVWLFQSNTTGTKSSQMVEDSGYLPAACATSIQSSADNPAIQACAWALKQLIDVRFQHYADSLMTAFNDGNTLVDVANIGLGSAGALTGGTTSQILSAIMAGLTGTQAKVNSDILYSKSIHLIIAQMIKDRANQEAVFLARVDKYTNMWQAANDLLIYTQAGTWTHAVVQMLNDSAAQTVDCQQQTQNARIASADGGSSAVIKALAGQGTGETSGNSQTAGDGLERSTKCKLSGSAIIQAAAKSK
ncbi:hypothetical protein FBZ89_103403 [Nitrospirillum amazonense]|uniref:Lipoprotein n=1 Tax=Nitrospirillum amazonense TaxID=28077 RepID=A0A560FMB8_9PROT|nr:hypothetical protein [Nitrospirillum amazonense]TWB22773.1 hypothetical protein FBZ89_103403 [Nitrospirillum amazonense]